MPNPFQVGTPIKDPAAFVGRKAELRRIFSALETAHTGQAQHIALVGERRIGKTSLLHQVTNTYTTRLQNPASYRFVFVDLDDAHCHAQAGLLGVIGSALRPDRSSVVPGPIGFALHEGASANPGLVRDLSGFSDLLVSLPYIPVICLDEFEHLVQRRGEFPDDFFTAMRSLASDGKLALDHRLQNSAGRSLRRWRSDLPLP